MKITRTPASSTAARLKEQSVGIARPLCLPSRDLRSPESLSGRRAGISVIFYYPLPGLNGVMDMFVGSSPHSRSVVMKSARREERRSSWARCEFCKRGIIIIMNLNGRGLNDTNCARWCLWGLARRKNSHGFRHVRPRRIVDCKKMAAVDEQPAVHTKEY